MAKFPKEVIAEAKRKARELEFAGIEDAASAEQGEQSVQYLSVVVCCFPSKNSNFNGISSHNS